MQKRMAKRLNLSFISSSSMQKSCCCQTQSFPKSLKSFLKANIAVLLENKNLLLHTRILLCQRITARRSSTLNQLMNNGETN